MIEGGLEGLVFNEQLLAWGEMVVGAAQGVFKPADAFADALGAGVVGAVGEPEGEIAGAKFLRDFYRIENVGDGLLADFGRGVAEGTELVFLILKEVGVDGACVDSVNLFEVFDLRDIGEAVWEIPEDVEG